MSDNYLKPTPGPGLRAVFDVIEIDPDEREVKFICQGVRAVTYRYDEDCGIVSLEAFGQLPLPKLE